MSYERCNIIPKSLNLPQVLSGMLFDASIEVIALVNNLSLSPPLIKILSFAASGIFTKLSKCI